MKLHSKKARVPIAALGVTALICGAGALVSPAFAVGETFTFLGADANAATIVAADTTLGGALSTFGVKISGQASSEARPLDVQVITAPATGSVTVTDGLANAAPGVNTTGSYTNGGTAVTVATSAGMAVGDSVFNALGATVGTITAVTDGTHVAVAATAAATQASGAIHTRKPTQTISQSSTTGTAVSGYTIGDNLYLGATVAGTYTLRLWRDTSSDNTYQSNADDATPTFTLTVKTPADAFTLSAPATVEAGTKAAMATVATTVSKTDIRGGSPATLASSIAGLLNLGITDNGTTGVTGDTAGGAASYDATNGIYRYFTNDTTTALSQGGGTPHSLTTALSFNGGSTLSSKTTEVTTNGVVTLATTVGAGQTDDVLDAGAGAIKVRPGFGTVVYTARAMDGAGTPAPLGSKTVTFTLAGTSGITLADLTANGVAVPTTGANAGKVTATTDADGYAALKVLSAKTANGNAYTVDATSGTATASPTLTTTYETAVSSTTQITSTSAELTPTVGTASVTVKGQLLDQYGEKFQPPTSDSQQVVVTGDATGNAVVTDGMFSYVFTPATTPTAGTTNSLTFTYNGHSATATIQWASTTAAGKVTLTTPVDGAKAVTIQDNTTPNPTQVNAGTPAFGNTSGAVTGTVYDASDAALAFKTVTLSGTDGVYFATSATPDATHKLSKTLDVVTNNSGAVTGAWVFFTKSGAAKVTATTGAVKDDASVTVDEPAYDQGFHIAVDDVAARPGQTVIVTGKVDDVFGNPVPNAYVNLSTGASTVGALGNNTPRTNSAGIFSTTFLAGSNQSGVVDLTATIDGLTADPTPVTAYATAGITLTKGNYQDTGKITVTETKLLLTTTAKLIGGGKAKVGGSFLPNTGVDIYSKASGAVSYTLLDSLQSDDEGDFGASYSIKKTTSYLAKSAGMSSKTATTKVYSSVTISAKSYSKRRATIWANGSPSAKGSLKFYRSVAGKDPLLKSMTSNSYGNGKTTVTLPTGTRYVYVVFDAPGTYAGASGTIKVKVK